MARNSIVSSPIEFKRTLLDTIAIIDGNPPAIGSDISASVANLLIKIDFLDTIDELKESHEPNEGLVYHG